MIHFSPMRTFMPDPLPSIKGKVDLITGVTLRRPAGGGDDSFRKKSQRIDRKTPEFHVAIDTWNWGGVR